MRETISIEIEPNDDQWSVWIDGSYIGPVDGYYSERSVKEVITNAVNEYFEQRKA